MMLQESTHGESRIPFASVSAELLSTFIFALWSHYLLL